MRVLLIILSLLLTSCNRNEDDPTPSTINDDLGGPISRPASGYGSDGTYTVAKVSFPSPTYSGKTVDIFYPQGITSPKPTIFFSHPYGGENSDYNIGLFNFIAKKGLCSCLCSLPHIWSIY